MFPSFVAMPTMSRAVHQYAPGGAPPATGETPGAARRNSPAMSGAHQADTRNSRSLAVCFRVAGGRGAVVLRNPGNGRSPARGPARLRPAHGLGGAGRDGRARPDSGP